MVGIEGNGSEDKGGRLSDSKHARKSRFGSSGDSNETSMLPRIDSYPERDAALPECPSGAPDYISKVLQICAEGPEDRMWCKVVWGWFELDQQAGFAGKGKLGTTGRPEAIAAWIARAQHVKWRPPYLNKDHPGDLKVNRFAVEFAKWWRGLQAGREEVIDSFISMSRSEGADWEGLKVRGPNGIASLIVGLAWWQEAVEAMPGMRNRERQEKEEQKKNLAEALSEVDYAFGELKHEM